MANSNPITVADKTTGDSLTAAEFQQILDALKNGTKDINALGIAGDSTIFVVDSGGNVVTIGATVTITGDNSSADTAYVPMILYNTDETPPAASGFPIGTLYVQYTA